MNRDFLIPYFLTDYENSRRFLVQLPGDASVLNREKVAEGKGFEPLDRVNGRRFSRPPISYKGQHSTTSDNEATGLLGQGELLWSMQRVVVCCGLGDREWTTASTHP